MSDDDPIRNHTREILSDDWSVLTRHRFEYRRRDGVWEPQVRQTYDRGDGAAVVPFDAARGTVLLVRQFRLPAYVTGHKAPLIEACAGVLDDEAPQACIRREAVEELGYRLEREAIQVFDIFMSPGSVTERLSLFVAAYTPADRIGDGGGDPAEGEDIEVLEPTLDEAMAMVARGEIIDAKTILLLQHLTLYGLSAPPKAS